MLLSVMVLPLTNNKFRIIAMAKTHSILLSASKTSLPIPSPSGMVMPGALNFNQASKKLMAHTKPIHRKVATTATGNFDTISIVEF